MSTQAIQMTRAGLDASIPVRAIDERGQPLEKAIAAERPLTLYIDKREVVTLMTLGCEPELLVLGWLRNQRLIERPGQIRAIQVDWETDSVAVTTRDGIDRLDSRLARKTVTTGCGQGTVFGDLMDDLEKIRLQQRPLRQSQIYQLLENISQHNEVYRQAGAVHGCALCRGSEVLRFVEDVGRHNAVDCLAGWMWLQQIDGSDLCFYTTGRLTSEMVLKCAHMGIPILVSRSGFTAWGVELARKVNMTLIGRMRGRRFVALSGVHRIVYDAAPEEGPEEDERLVRKGARRERRGITPA